MLLPGFATSSFVSHLCRSSRLQIASCSLEITKVRSDWAQRVKEVEEAASRSDERARLAEDSCVDGTRSAWNGHTETARHTDER